jgi:hypothetical protein
MEFIKVYNAHEFNGFSEDIMDFLPELESQSDEKFKRIYLRRIMNDDIGKIERRLLGAYGTESIKDYQKIFQFS